MNLKPAATPKPAGRGWLWLAFAWGFAESTFFFLVPDVLTSRLVLRRTQSGFAACFSSLAGALLGGGILYFLGQHHAPALLAAFDWLPGVSPGLVEQARRGLAEQQLGALFTGVLGGIPYKLYATQAAASGIGPGLFLLASIFARLTRFLLVTGMAWLIGTKLLPNLATGTKLRIHLVAWLVFYSAYFWRMGV